MEEKTCYLESKIKSSCTGCRACVESCPKKCISMQMDSEYFYYPMIDKNKCIDCQKCKKVCPVLNDVSRASDLKFEMVYGYKTKNEKELLTASSGGAFADIARAFCENKKEIAIFGAKFNNELKVVHDYVTDIKDIDVFKKSKYVQSDIKNSYSKVKEFLTKENFVVFTGTPCQIAGLKSYLNKDYENLLCVDIVCHGVPAQGIFDMAMDIESTKYNSKVLKVNFREKIVDKTGIYNSRNIKMSFEDGNEVIKSSQENMYLKGFHNALYYRPSCYECKFSNINRYSDITIADCWGIEKVDSNIDIHKGYSCIVIHTDKGRRVFEKIKNCELIELTLDFIIKNNKQYSKPSIYNKNRVKFYNGLNKENFEKKVKKYTKVLLLTRIINKIKRMLLMK